MVARAPGDFLKNCFYIKKKGLTFRGIIFSSSLNIFSAERKTVERATFSLFVKPNIYITPRCSKTFIFLEINLKAF